MTDQTLARIEQRLARVERTNRILVGLMGAMAVVVSIGATHAASNVVVADEVRVQRFTLLDPHGGIAHRLACEHGVEGHRVEAHQLSVRAG